VLSLSLSEEFAKELLHWRTSRPHEYPGSPLNGDDEFDPATGVAVGQAARNVKLAEDDYLFDRLADQPGFCVLVFAGASGVTPKLASLLLAAAQTPFPVVRAIIGTHVAGVRGELAELTLEDRAGRIARKYGAGPGNVYLLRPDRHVCARWRCADAARLRAALSHSASAPAPSSLRANPGMS
jgi:3-(3-hydroxy-phenyl)propionate hydroxylase